MSIIVLLTANIDIYYTEEYLRSSKKSIVGYMSFPNLTKKSAAIGFDEKKANLVPKSSMYQVQ